MACLLARVFSHSLHRNFFYLLQFLPEDLQHTRSRMNRMGLSVVCFIRKNWSKSSNNGIVYNEVGLQCIGATFIRQKTRFFYNGFTGATVSGRSIGSCDFGNIVPVNVPKCQSGKIHVSWRKMLRSCMNFTIWNPVFTLLFRMLHTLIQERHNHNESCVKVFRITQKVRIYLANEGSGIGFFSTDLGHILWNNVDNEFGVMLRGKGPYKPDMANDIVRIHSVMIYTDLIEYDFVGNAKFPLLHCFFSNSAPKSDDIITPLDKTWTIRYLATCNLDHCSKLLFIIFTKTWETRALDK